MFILRLLMPSVSSVNSCNCCFVWNGVFSWAFSQYCHWKQERKMWNCLRLLVGSNSINSSLISLPSIFTWYCLFTTLLYTQTARTFVPCLFDKSSSRNRCSQTSIPIKTIWKTSPVPLAKSFHNLTFQSLVIMPQIFYALPKMQYPNF